MDVLASLVDRIESAFPDVDLQSVELNQEGLVNDVVIVNHQLVFRFPKSEWAKKALADEARVLAVVGKHVALTIPQIEVIEAGMSCHVMVPGQPLTRGLLLSLGTAARQDALDRLAAFLHAMYSIPGWELTDLPRSDVARTREDWLALYHRVEAEMFPHLMRYQRDWVRSLFAPVETGELDLRHEPVLVHGDLAPYHLLFDADAHQLSGVIDFGTAGVGDPASDIACLIYHYGESVVRQLGQTCPIVEEVIERARFWAETLELQWALAGLRDNDRSLLVAHIGGARDVTSPGSPWAPDRVQRGRGA